MGRTTGTVGTARATGTASMTGGLPDTGTGPPRTSCSKLEKQSDVCIRFHFWQFFLLQTLNFGLIWPQHFRPIVLWDWDAQCQTSNRAVRRLSWAERPCEQDAMLAAARWWSCSLLLFLECPQSSPWHPWKRFGLSHGAEFGIWTDWLRLWTALFHAGNEPRRLLMSARYLHKIHLGGRNLADWQGIKYLFYSSKY